MSAKGTEKAAQNGWTTGWITLKPKKPECANCKTDPPETAVYCVECNKSFCRFCAVLLHHPSTKNEKHSLEEIASYQGVKIITPILLDLFLIAAAGFMLSGPGIGPEYFNGNSYCPALSRGRRFVAHFDANLFFYHKAHMATYCDWEDSYWRFFMDTWVRGILTNTDSWLLLLSEWIRALIFEEFFRVLLTPIIAFAYALVAAFFVFIEYEIFKVIYEDIEGGHADMESENEAQRTSHPLTKFFQTVEWWVETLSFASKVIVTDKKCPPLTLYRKRPYEDWIELATYFYRRQTRMFQFYRAQAQSACRFVLRGSMVAALFIRVVCIAFGSSYIVACVRVVLGDAMGSTYVQWFAEATGTGVQDLRRGGYTDTPYSDWFVQNGMTAALAGVQILPDAGEDAAHGFFGVVVALIPLLKRLLIPALILLPPPALFWWKIKNQRKQFKSDWKKKTCKEIWGSEMSRKAPASNWEGLRFASHKIRE